MEKNINICNFCGKKGRKYIVKKGNLGNGIESTTHLMEINDTFVKCCHDCHVKYVRCSICDEYAPHGIFLNRFSKTRVCEECSEKIDTCLNKETLLFKKLINVPF